VHTYGLRFDVNCSILFTELPLLKRPAAARSAGFDAVEFWWPFAEPVPADGEVDSFVRALGDAGGQGYAGWIGCEYKPSDPADSATSFGWRATEPRSGA
jgi:hydroxypyruvate isomerase